MRESKIQEAVNKRAARYGWEAHRNKKSGDPDRYYTRYEREVIFIEYKKDGKDPTEQQFRAHERLRDQGFEVHVIDSIEEGYEIFDSR